MDDTKKKYFGEAVILCGGLSSRMPYNKSFIRINGRYLIDTIYEKLEKIFRTVKLSVSSSETYSVFNHDMVEDIIEGKKGPSVGIYSALENATSRYVFIVAGDMPYINLEHIEYMKKVIEENEYMVDALVPLNGGYIEPLYSFYSIDMAHYFKEELDKGNYKIKAALDRSNTMYMDEKHSKRFEANLNMFTNINYIEDLEKIL